MTRATFATVATGPPPTPERALLLAVLGTLVVDLQEPCAAPRRCLRADAIAAAQGDRVRVFAELLDLGRLVDRLGTTPPCCGRTRAA